MSTRLKRPTDDDDHKQCIEREHMGDGKTNQSGSTSEEML